MHITQALHRSVQQSPDCLATVFGDRQTTFTDQAGRVACLAGGLRAVGVRDGTRVGILALNSDRYAELLFAVPWADGVVTPFNTRWSAAELVYAIVDSDTTVLFIDDTFAAMAPALQEGCDDLRTLIFMGEGAVPTGMVGYEEFLGAGEAIDDARRGGDELAGIFYTGGTTGDPKGVMISHTNLLVSALGSQATSPWVVPGGRLVHAAPMFHLADLAAWTAQSMVGGTHVIVPAFDPVAVMACIEDQAITTALLVPTMLQMLVDHPQIDAHDLSSVKTVIYGASPISESLLDRVMQAFSTADFVQAYGMTELAPVATMLTAQDHRSRMNLRSAGRTAAHCELRIVDESDVEVARGSVGEVVVRGDHVMLGYWNKPDETARALRGGWMHTGDIAYMDPDGYVFIVDRLKDMIISGGENVYSTEVENAIAGHPAVAACAVIGVPDVQWGERVHAVIVLKDGASATADEIEVHVKELIAGYKAPRSVEFVDQLPISGAGKILKRELRAGHWDGESRSVR